MAPYLGTLLCNRYLTLSDSRPDVILAVISTILCLPHFFEHESKRLPNGNIVSGEAEFNEQFYYKLLYYSILDPLIR